MFPEKTEMLVVGGGVVGGAIAYNLAKRGREVTLLERGELAGGASGGNLGQISITDREAGFELDWALRSLDLYREYEAEGWLKADFEQTGGLFVLGSAGELAQTAHLPESRRRDGVEVQLLQAEEIARQEPLLNPAALAGALYCPLEGKVDPLAVSYGFWDAAAAAGATLWEHTAVLGFECEGNRITAVQADRGRLAADTVVLATGAWTAELAQKLGLCYPIGYDRANVYVCQPVPPALRGPIAPGVFLTGSFEGGNWVQLGAIQHKNGSILIGQSTRAAGDYSTAMAYEEPGEISRMFARHFPGLAQLQVVRMWSGVTPSMPDEKPLFGFSRRWKNLFMAAGLKGAFTTAPAAGQDAAALILRQRSKTDCSACSPARFEEEEPSHAH